MGDSSAFPTVEATQMQLEHLQQAFMQRSPWSCIFLIIEILCFPFSSTFTNSEFPNLSTTDILGQEILCCSIYCRIFSSNPSLHSRVNSTRSSSYGSKKNPSTLPDSPCRAKLAQLRSTRSSKMGRNSIQEALRRK